MTFVVPCYNHGHFLPACVRSILAQTWGDFEVLIMDNCSLDNTADVAQSFGDSRVKHIRNDTNLGHIRNFNKGIALARGKYVWLVSADDSLRDPTVLAHFVDVMSRSPRVGYIFCRAVEIHGQEEMGTARWTDCGETDAVWDGQTFLSRLTKNNCIAMSSVMVRRECYDATLFPADLPFAGDWYIWCTFAMRYQVAYCARPMVNFRLDEQSLTSTFNRTDARICLSDEVAVLWRLGCQAKLAGKSWLHRRCKASLAIRWAESARLTSETNVPQGLNEVEVSVIVQQHVNDANDYNDIRAHAQVIRGDDYYWAGEYDHAARSYLLGIRLQPWRIQSWAKYILLRMGTLGVRLRRLRHGRAARFVTLG